MNNKSLPAGMSVASEGHKRMACLCLYLYTSSLGKEVFQPQLKPSGRKKSHGPARQFFPLLSSLLMKLDAKNVFSKALSRSSLYAILNVILEANWSGF